MKNTVGHTGIYAWGDCVRHRFFQKLRSNRRTKNPLPLGMGSVKIFGNNGKNMIRVGNMDMFSNGTVQSHAGGAIFSQSGISHRSGNAMFHENGKS